jgi:hypothetical protein
MFHLEPGHENAGHDGIAMLGSIAQRSPSLTITSLYPLLSGTFQMIGKAVDGLCSEPQQMGRNLYISAIDVL